MAFRNTSPSSKGSSAEEFDDIPIVPPKPIAQKEYKEEVPDISVVSFIADNGSQLQHFQRNSLRPQARYNVLNGNINHTSYQEQLGINSCVPKTVSDITKKTIEIVDRTALPFKLCATCESCVLNHAIITNNRYNEQYVPKNRAPIPLAIGDEQSDKEMRSKYEDGEAISNKTGCKHVDSNVTASSNHKSGTCIHTQFSCALNSNEPEISQIVNIPDCCYSNDQHSKLRKSLSNCERHENKLLCPVCFKKNCKCNFLGKKCNTNPSKNSYNSAQITEKVSGNASHVSSDEVSSIWEYLKRLDEKINSIHKKVSNFLSQHASCCIDQPTQRDELSNVTERDIPYILSILGEHSDQITELRGQINLKSSEHKSSPTNNNKIDKSILNEAQTISCDNIENCNEDIHCLPSHNVEGDEQRQKVTKTSTSTMTSFAIENDDKLIYCKQLTVVTDIMREKEESSSCLQKEHEIPTTKNNLYGKNVKSNSQKRKSHKLKCSPILKCKTNVSLNSSTDLPDSNDKQVLKTSHKSERKSKRTSGGNRAIDKRYVNDSASDNDAEEQKNSPILKTDVHKSHPRSSKQKPKKSMSPKVISPATIKDPRNKEMNQEISLSSSSTDTEYISPKQRQEMLDKIELDSEEEPSYLSVATIKYLDKYGLNHRDKNERTESSRKTSLSKRYV